MKTVTRVIIIGLFHSTLYLYLMPKVILPLAGGYKREVAILVTISSVIITMTFIRFNKIRDFFSKRLQKKI